MCCCAWWQLAGCECCGACCRDWNSVRSRATARPLFVRAVRTQWSAHCHQRSSTATCSLPAPARQCVFRGQPRRPAGQRALPLQVRGPEGAGSATQGCAARSSQGLLRGGVGATAGQRASALAPSPAQCLVVWEAWQQPVRTHPVSCTNPRSYTHIHTQAQARARCGLQACPFARRAAGAAWPCCLSALLLLQLQLQQDLVPRAQCIRVHARGARRAPRTRPPQACQRARPGCWAQRGTGCD